jgi:hypothetical protein
MDAKIDDMRVTTRIKEMRDAGVSGELIDSVAKEARDFKNFGPIIWLHKEANSGRSIDPTSVADMIAASRIEPRKLSFIQKVTRAAQDMTIAVQIDWLLANGVDQETVNALATDARENRNLEPLERLFKEMHQERQSEPTPVGTGPRANRF